MRLSTSSFAVMPFEQSAVDVCARPFARPFLLQVPGLWAKVPHPDTSSLESAVAATLQASVLRTAFKLRCALRRFLHVMRLVQLRRPEQRMRAAHAVLHLRDDRVCLYADGFRGERGC